MSNPIVSNSDLRSTLETVRHGGCQADLRCPAHDDHRASLSVGRGDDGRLLLHCHAGCTPDAVLASAGLTWADVHEPRDTPEPRKRVVATYRYEDERGAHLFDVMRFEPKDFRQRAADGTWTVKGIRKVLYGLPELQGAMLVYMGEGEEDAKALRGLGLVATCNSGGAGKWLDEHTKQLKAAGVRVVRMLPDNDGPGHAHAEKVKASCWKHKIACHVVDLPGLEEHGDIRDWINAGGTREQLEELFEQQLAARGLPSHVQSDAAPNVEPNTAAEDVDDAVDESRGNGRGPSQATQLVDLARTLGIELWHTPNGDSFGTITIDGHLEHHPLRRVVRDFLARSYYRAEKRAASSQALTDAAATLHGQALYDGDQHDAAVRLGAADGALYLDLGDTGWTTIRITADGWSALDEPAPIRHWRPGTMRPLPAPTRGGRLDAFRELWPALDDDTWTVLASWLLSTMMPRGPYPILVETGEQGSGKSTLGRMLRDVIDPASPALRGVPRDERDVVIGARVSHVLALDNLSGLPVWLSDALCRLSTGGGMATRTLYTDMDESTVDVTRPVLLTGIESPATRGDLLDRALVVTLPAIRDEGRVDEAVMWQRYADLRPSLLGALLDAAACALRRRAEVQLEKKPRMADACLWVTAAEPALGWPNGRTVTTWLGARETASADLLASDPVAMAVMSLDETSWSGTASALLQVLGASVPERTRTSKAWPTSARALSGTLRRLAPDLRRAGVEVTLPDGARNARERVVRIDRVCIQQDTQDRQDTSTELLSKSSDSPCPVGCPVDPTGQPTGQQQDAKKINEIGRLSGVSYLSGPKHPKSTGVDHATERVA